MATFAEPVQITFPNVFNAAPGTKLNILSFDHTTGRLVINGTATVSADGLTVVSDEGSGIRAPGWHGLTPPGDCGVAARHRRRRRRRPTPADTQNETIRWSSRCCSAKGGALLDTHVDSPRQAARDAAAAAARIRTARRRHEPRIRRIAGSRRSP